MLYAIYANSSLIYINPLLSILGYRIYKVEFVPLLDKEEDVDAELLISRKRIRKNQEVSTCELSDGIYLDSK